MADATPTRLPDSCYVVVPAYNEAPRLGRTLEGLLEVASSVVVVDDGSADNTRQVALQYPVWVLRHPVNLGQGAAIQTGITFALRQGAEYVATFDAD
ncbi:MAG: glycosyltransferase, partial [Candidatus Methanomethylicaceae archaeon]